MLLLTWHTNCKLICVAPTKFSPGEVEDMYRWQKLNYSIFDLFIVVWKYWNSSICVNMITCVYFIILIRRNAALYNSLKLLYISQRWNAVPSHMMLWLSQNEHYKILIPLGNDIAPYSQTTVQICPAEPVKPSFP